MKTLQFSKVKVLKNLFSSGTCCVVDEVGNKSWRGVVIDGRANGILGYLPRFSRPIEAVEAAQRISTLQYIVRLPKLREFIDVIF